MVCGPGGVARGPGGVARGPGGVVRDPGGVAWVERNLTCARIYHFTSRSAITRQR